MRFGFIWHVTAKELLSSLRDRRAIVSSLIIPLLILPAVMLGLPLLLGSLFEREQDTRTEVAVKGLEYLPAGLLDLLEAETLLLVEDSNPEEAVRSGQFQVGLVIPQMFQEQLQTGKAKILTYSKQGNLRSELNEDKIRNTLLDYRDSYIRQRLIQEGLDPSILEPLRIETIDASSKAERQGGQLAWLIPFFIAIWTLTGGQIIALDATAGEKERGTLESLLVSPIKKIEVVLGKWIATLLFGLTASLMAIVGYVLGGTILRQLFSQNLGEDASELVAIMGGSFAISASSFFLLFTSALLLAGLIASLLIGIALFARSYKEAQSYVAPLSFIMIVPAIGLQFADFFTTNLFVYLVPILNALLLMDDVVKAKAQLPAILLTWGSLLVFSLILLDFAYRNFKREEVIFRT